MSRWAKVPVLAALAGVALTVAVVPPPGRARQAPSRPPDIFYVPTLQVVADAMLTLAGTSSSDVVYDLGSGDGRLVIIAAQKHGARGVGIEIQPHLVARARQTAEEGGVADRVRFIEGDLFAADLSSATVVTLYLSTSLMRALMPKLQRELRPGARIVSHQFQFPGWPPDRMVTVENAHIYLWTVPPR